MLVEELERAGLGDSREEVVEAVYKTQLDSLREHLEKHVEGKVEPCASCGSKEGNRRCTGCFEANYCSKKCQVKAWGEGHRSECKEVRKQYREVILHTEIAGPDGVRKTRGVFDSINRKERLETPRSRFPVTVWVWSLEDLITIHNKDSSLFGVMDRDPGQEEVYDHVRKQVEEKGTMAEVEGKGPGVGPGASLFRKNTKVIFFCLSMPKW